jgi:glycosyltransferase involved in cell wall biosynthesis
MVLRNVVSPRVSVIVPAKNEAANLREVLPRLPQVHEVILVDGNSVDDTVAAAREVMPDIRVVRQTRKGKGNALACGFLAASGDILVMFDADGSADPDEIPAYVQALVEGADFAKGSRFAPGGGSEDITKLRAWGNAGLNLVANTAFGTTFTDLCYGYNAFWRDLVPVLDLPDIDLSVPAGEMVWGDGFEIETVINCRFAAAQVAISEVPSVELLRIHGESNLRTFSDGARVLRTIMAERRRMRRTASRGNVTSLDALRNFLHPRTDLIEADPSDQLDGSATPGNGPAVLARESFA